MADVDKRDKAEEIEEEEIDVDESGDQKDKDDNESGGKDDDKKEQKKSSKTFSQEQVTRMMTREKNQGRNAALKELGIDPKDTKMIATVKALIEAQKSDEQKKIEQEQKANSELDEANRRAEIAEAKAEAMQLGVKSQFVDDAITLAMAKVTDDTDLKTVLGEFKQKYPLWFEADEDDKNSTGKKGTGSSVKDQKGGKKKETQTLGARLAAKRKPKSNKRSYCSKN